MELESLAEDSFYIANQNSSMFDEIQRMAIAYQLGQPIGIEGKPGVGKNEAINTITKALGKKAYRIRCTEETMARDIIGGEKLEAEKSSTGSLATKTTFSPGKLYQGMDEGNLVILDEINQLQLTVQKSLNSVLEDQRTISDLEGNCEELSAKEGFGLFLTWNPETGITNQDLESAVRDRCKVLYFEELPTELKLRIAMLKSGKFSAEDILQNGITARGIYSTDEGIQFAELKNEQWIKYKRRKVVQEEVTPYFFYDRKKAGKLEFSDPSKNEFYQVGRAIVNSLERIEELRVSGTSKVSRDFGIRLAEVSRLNLNPSSPRLVNKLLDDYLGFREAKYKPGEILGDLSKSIVDFTVPPTERDLEIGEEYNVTQLVEYICGANGIINDSMICDLKTRVMKDSRSSLTHELMNRGFDQRVAEHLVREYS